MLVLVIPLALVAALFYALSDFFEQRAAQRNTAVEADRPTATGVVDRVAEAAVAGGRTLRRLVRDRIWFLGWALGILAYGLQGTALNLGSVAVVQALQVTSLIFTLPLSAIGQPMRPAFRDWAGVAGVVGGLVLFLVGRGAPPTVAEVHRGRLLALVVLLVAGTLLLAVLAALRSGPTRATLLAVAAGSSFATSATLVKLTSDDLVSHGILATATDWPGYALAGTSVIGVVLQQLAFASGRLPVAATAMIVANPVVGTLIAIVGFAEPLPSDPARLGVLAFGAAMVVAGVTALAHSPLLAAPLMGPDRTDEEAGQRVRRPDGAR